MLRSGYINGWTMLYFFHWNARVLDTLTSIISIRRMDLPVWCYQSFLNLCKSDLFLPEAFILLHAYHSRTNPVCFLHSYIQAIPVCGHVYNFSLQLCGIWCSLCQPSGQPHGSEPRSTGQEQGHPSWCDFTWRAVHWEVSVSALYSPVYMCVAERLYIAHWIQLCL